MAVRSSPVKRHFSLTAGARGAHSEFMATGRSPPEGVLTRPRLHHQTLYWHLFLVSSPDQGGRGAEASCSKLNCVCLN